MIIESRLKRIRQTLYYPHDDSACNCVSCQVIDEIDKALEEAKTQAERIKELENIIERQK